MHIPLAMTVGTWIVVYALDAEVDFSAGVTFSTWTTYFIMKYYGI